MTNEQIDVDAILAAGNFLVPWSELTQEAKDKIPANIRRIVRTMPDDLIAVVIVRREEDHSHTIISLGFMSVEDFEDYKRKLLEKFSEEADAEGRAARFRATMNGLMNGN